jgi:4-amino-4-deoxy-L-arabinose transferase-like glycosyltransferase
MNGIFNRALRAAAWAYERDLFLLPLLAGAFAIRAYAINLPGPYGDEVSFVLPAYQLKWGVPPTWGDPSSAGIIRLFDRQLPLMLNAYTGALPIYAQLLFSHILGSVWFGYRLLDVLYGLSAIALSYVFARDLFGRRAAVMAALLLSFMPSLVFYSRIGEPVIYLRLVQANAAALCFFRWWRTRAWPYYYVGCLCIGLGLSTRLEIIWWIGAILLYVWVAERPVFREVAARLTSHPPRILMGLSLVAVGAGLLILYNLRFPGRTLAFLLRNLMTTFYGHHNVAVAHNLYVRLHDLAVLLDGSDKRFVAYQGPLFANYLFPALFAICFGTLVWQVLRGIFGRRLDRRAAFLVVAAGSILVMSTLTVSTLEPYQLLIMMPFPVLIIVYGLECLGHRLVTGLLVMALIVSDAAVDTLYYRSLVKTEGVGLFSSGIFDLAAYLQHQPRLAVVSCDWQILELLEFVSRGQIRGSEIFGYELGPGRTPASFYDDLAAALRNPASVFVFYAPRFEQYLRHQAFLEYLKGHGRSFRRRVFSDRNGPVYYLYRVDQSPPVSWRPQ